MHDNNTNFCSDSSIASVRHFARKEKSKNTRVMAQQLEEFEKRAKMAEDQIAELTKRLGVLERRGESAPSNNANASKLQLLDEVPYT